MAAGVLKAVQSGTATIAAGAASGTATVTAVTLANSIVDFSYQTATGASSAYEYGNVTVTFTNTTTLTFTRGVSASTPLVNIVWYVSEFTSGVTVQRGTKVVDNSGTTISAVTVAQSWPITNIRTPNATLNTSLVISSITTTTNLALTMLDPGDTSAGSCGWQVIQYDNCTTALYTTTKTSNGTTNQTVTSVTTEKALVYSTWYISGEGTTGLGAVEYPRVYLSSTTNVAITMTTSNGSGSADVFKTYTIDITDSVTVQRGDTSIASGDTTTNAALTTVNQSNAMAHVTGAYENSCGTSSYTTDGRYSRNWHSAQITTTTNLALVRAESGSTATLAWEEIEWAAGAAGWAYASIIWIPEYTY